MLVCSHSEEMWRLWRLQILAQVMKRKAAVSGGRLDVACAAWLSPSQKRRLLGRSPGCPLSAPGVQAKGGWPRAEPPAGPSSPLPSLPRSLGSWSSSSRGLSPPSFFMMQAAGGSRWAKSSRETLGHAGGILGPWSSHLEEEALWSPTGSPAVHRAAPA